MMTMEGYDIQFKVFAHDQEEADRTSLLLKKFVDDYAKNGIAVTASKISAAVTKYKDSFILTTYFR